MAITPRAIHSTLLEHQRRLDGLEDKVSETRSAVVGVDKSAAIILTRIKLIEKLIFAVIIGIGALVGSDIYHRIMGL